MGPSHYLVRKEVLEMIYGIKQIEKQFPGFEARMVGGQVFDLREIFQKYEEHTKHTDGIKQQCDEIFDKYWDIIIPPAEKMYLIIGKNTGAHEDGHKEKLYTEYACTVKKASDNDIIVDLIVHEQFTKIGKGFALHVGAMMISKNINHKGTHYGLLIPEVLNNEERFAKHIIGIHNDEFKKSIMQDWYDILCEHANAFMYSLVLSLFYINIKNIKQKTSYVSQLRDYYYPKAWGREYKVLSLSQTLTERSPGPDLPIGYHVRGHFQRGHFKRKKTGVYWWNPHWRGDFSKGIVMKDYKMKGEINASENRKEVVPVPQGENAVVVH